MFCLVEFEGPSKDTAIAHRNWLRGNKCYWPPFWKTNSKYISALKCGMIPDPTTWTLYDVHVINDRYFDTYEQARRKLNLPQKSLDASELSSMEDESRLRKRVAEESCDDESSESETPQKSNIVATPKIAKRRRTRNDNVLLSKPPSPPMSQPFVTPSQLYQHSPTLVAVADMLQSEQVINSNAVVHDDQGSINQFQMSQSNTGSVEDQSPVRNFSSIQSGSMILPGTTLQQQPSVYIRQAGSGDDRASSTTATGFLSPTPISSSSGRHFQLQHTPNASGSQQPSSSLSTMFAEILQGQALLGAKLDLTLDYLKTLCSGQHLRNHVPSGEIKLPLTSLEEADALDNRLKENSTLKQELIDSLATRGGNNANQITYRIMSILMTNELMTMFTFAGRSGDRRCFRDTMFLSCICGAVRKQPKGALSSDKEVEKAVEYWLKKAPNRILKQNSNNASDV